MTYSAVYADQTKTISLPPIQSTSDTTGYLSQQILDDACRWADSEVSTAAGVVTDSTISAEEHEGNDLDYFYVDHPPLLSVTTLQVKSSDTSYTTVTTSTLELTKETGKVYLLTGAEVSTFTSSYPLSTKITYTRGVSSTGNEFYLLQALACHIAKQYILENGSKQLAEMGINVTFEVERIKEKTKELRSLVGKNSGSYPLL